MTLLIHFLMCLTTMFERGVPVEEPPSNAQQLSEGMPSNNLGNE